LVKDSIAVWLTSNLRPQPAQLHMVLLVPVTAQQTMWVSRFDHK